MSARQYARREFIKRSSLAAAALAAPRGLSAGDSPRAKPNIIVAMIDNVGYGDFGINGNDIVRTPHLDRFAAEGIQFSRFCCNPMCTPTRASLMTGRYYYRTGVIHTSRGGALMHGDEVTIAEHLRQAGYATGMFGKWHLGNNYPMRPQDQGFDQTLWHKSGTIGQVPDAPNTYIDPMLWRRDRKTRTKGYCTDIFFDEAMRFIEANRHRPFFVYLPTNVGHTRLESDVGPLVPDQYKDPYKTAGLSNSIANVYGMVTNFDENFGRLLARLESLGLRENTIVIFTSDDGPGHGYNAGLRNGTIYEARIRVPFFVQWQGRLQRRRTCDRVASHIDILPTLLDLSGVRTLEEPVIDGTSLLPLLEGRETAWPDRQLFLQCHRGLEPKRYQNCAVITQQYKMVGYPGSFKDENLKTSSENPVLELYDLINDPGEQKDLADTHPEILTSLRSLYDDWFDDVRSTRNFTPGYIHIGNPAENPTHLCRYQDSAYVNGEPTGWLVNIEREGDYEFTTNRGDHMAPGRMRIRINDKVLSKPLSQGANTATFQLPAGKMKLEVWVQEDGKPHKRRAEQDTIGDVDLRRL